MLDYGKDYIAGGRSDETDGANGRKGNLRMPSTCECKEKSSAKRASRRFQPVEELMNRFVSRENGSTTIEFVLWLPLLVGVLIVAVDASVLYMRQSNLWQVSRDTARIVSRHAMDEATAEAYARQQATYGSYVPTVDVVMSGQAVTVTLAANLTEIAPIGIFNFALSDQLTASITHAMEPR